ncbi:hypothetical protein R1T16_13380 [Flavobacterium sp. DG1-102-2]|uniref:hypothetical protein n=1 Tax=Flavobacterium sp. DG1-102-2 TaxID=3081663 RepID=UPI002949F2F6|nr:hypothetical protein [Flavobacterium sp. DG1-102-2]MDV6169421.1 hypothetical protein [Flavobacterium sp. DG1-102-2]
MADQNTKLINGLGVSRKTKHFVINPNWNDQKIIEEMAHTWTNKKQIGNKESLEIKHNGIIHNTNQTNYKSIFSDGTEIEIFFRDTDVDPISGDLVNNHISLFAIIKT